MTVVLDKLEELAEKLTETLPGTSNIPAGYTYLGQMISHDIVTATQQEMGFRQIRAGAGLSLDSLYALTTEGTSDYLTDGRFSHDKDRPWDVKRDEDGRALIPEPRNDENIIIAQLHRVWQKVHNRLFELEGCKYAAREQTVLLFQTVVIEDYLQRILQPNIFDGYFRRGERHLAFDEKTIAPEFSRAAFRFGHSMVRASYDLNDNHVVRLSEIFRRGSKISQEYAVSWPRFFETDPDKRPQQALRIDTAITKGMTAVTGVGANSQNAVLRNLQAGAMLGTGAEYVTGLLQGADIGDKPRIDPRLHLRPIGNGRTEALGVPVNELPMLPYILLEAELAENGLRLGTLGSLIVAETLQNAIRVATPSVFTNGVYRAELVLKKRICTGQKLLDAAAARRGLTERSLDMRAIFEFIGNPEM